jgi:hypothetical protein
MGSCTMHSRPRLAAVAVLAGVLTVGVAACGSDDSPSGGGGAQPAATTAAPGATAAPATRQPAEPAVLGNGRHPVILKQVNVAGRTVTFDLIQWFEGEAAAKAAAEDGQESPPPNDYYTRNVNPRLRTLPVTAGARLTLTRLTVDQGTGNAAGAVPVDLATVAARGRNHIFWATVQGGQILRLEEQYIP